MYLHLAAATENAVLDCAVVLNGYVIQHHTVEKLDVAANRAAGTNDAALQCALLPDLGVRAQHAASCHHGFWSD